MSVSERREERVSERKEEKATRFLDIRAPSVRQAPRFGEREREKHPSSKERGGEQKEGEGERKEGTQKKFSEQKGCFEFLGEKRKNQP